MCIMMCVVMVVNWYGYGVMNCFVNFGDNKKNFIIDISKLHELFAHLCAHDDDASLLPANEVLSFYEHFLLKQFLPIAKELRKQLSAIKVIFHFSNFIKYIFQYFKIISISFLFSISTVHFSNSLFNSIQFCKLKILLFLV